MSKRLFFLAIVLVPFSSMTGAFDDAAYGIGGVIAGQNSQVNLGSEFLDYFDYRNIPSWKRHPAADQQTCEEPSSWPTSDGHFTTLSVTDLYKYNFPRNQYARNYRGDLQNRDSEGSGFFDVKRVGRNYYFIDPDGFYFYSKGVNTVRPYLNGATTANAFNQKFSGATESERLANWGAHTTSLLRSKHFNTFGSWSHDDRDSEGPLTEFGLSGEPPLARTPNLELLQSYTHLTWGGRKRQVEYLEGLAEQINSRSNSGEKAVNAARLRGLLLFRDYGQEEDRFDGYVRRRLESRMSDSVINDRRILGFFTDNEIPWSPDLLDVFVRVDDGEGPKEYARHWLQDNIANPDIRWGVTQNLLHGRTGGANTQRARREFLEDIVTEYFKRVTEPFRELNPNHLILGSRFFKHQGALSNKSESNQSLTEPEIFRAAGKYVDVVSINYYNSWSPTQSEMDHWVQASGRPFMITEFYVKGRNTSVPGVEHMPNCSGAGWIVKNQWERGRFYQNFFFSVLRHPGSVGLHWFNYMDNDPIAVSRASASNRGIVDVEFTPHGTVVDNMRNVNRTTYRVRYRLQEACSKTSVYCPYE